jgi:hypothetical protein
MALLSSPTALPTLPAKGLLSPPEDLVRTGVISLQNAELGEGDIYPSVRLSLFAGRQASGCHRRAAGAQ